MPTTRDSDIILFCLVCFFRDVGLGEGGGGASKTSEVWTDIGRSDGH